MEMLYRSCGKLCALLAAAVLDDLAARRGCHTCAETRFFLTLAITWLKRPLHDCSVLSYFRLPAVDVVAGSIVLSIEKQKTTKTNPQKGGVFNLFTPLVVKKFPRQFAMLYYLSTFFLQTIPALWFLRALFMGAR